MTILPVENFGSSVEPHRACCFCPAASRRPGTPLDLRVEHLRVSKDRTSLRYNGFLTLEGLPPEVHDQRLGNRSALDWVVDQYRIERAKDGPITSDANHDDDPDSILRLIGQVVTVSVETMGIVRALPPLA